MLEKEEALNIARNIFKEWNYLLQTKDPKQVAEIYTENNILFPTLSGDFEFGREGDIEYFEHFLKKRPFGNIIKDDVIIAGDSIIHVGMYDFEVDGFLRTRHTVKARFTFVYVKDANGEWKIAHHHSSIKPKVMHEGDEEKKYCV